MTDFINPLERLKGALASQPPSVIANAMRRADKARDAGQFASPVEGQCWRLRWNDDVLLAVITRTKNEYVLAMPVSLNPDDADETAVIVPGGTAGFGHDVAVFAMLETGVGLWTLEFPVGDLVGPSGASMLRNWLKGTAGHLPDGWQPGHPTPHDAHPRRENRRELGATITSIGSADWLSDDWSRDRSAQMPNQPAVTSDDLEKFWKVLGDSKQRAANIALGTVQPTPEEYQQLVTAGLYTSYRSPDIDLIHFLDDPSAKSWVLLIALRTKQDEGELRRELAANVLAYAARTHRAAYGSSTEPESVSLAKDEIRRRLANSAG